MYLHRIVASWSIRRKLLLLILIVCLPAAGIIVYDSIKERGKELEGAKHRAILMVESLSVQQEQIAAGTRQMLRTLARLPQIQNLDAEACNKLLRELKDQNPIYSAIGLVTPDGNMVANALHFEPGSVNLSDRKHVKDAIRTLDFSPGEYIVNRINNVPSINYGYPVLDADKRLIAIVTAGFRLTEYESFIKKADLPQGSAVVIVDRQGLRLYRYPENDASPLGQPPAVGFELSMGPDSGTCERKSDDGMYRIVAFKRLRLTESSSPYLFIAAGVPKDQILQKANFAMAWNLLILGLATAIAASLAWFLGNVAFTRPISLLVVATQRLGNGEMGARTGLFHTHDELGKLAQSIDIMAELLEQRNLERKKAEEELISAFRNNQLILNAAGEGIVGLDDKGTITFANPAALEMLGYDEEELIGRDLHPIIHHSFPDGTRYPEEECPMWQCLRNGAGSRVRDEVLWKKDGTNFPTAYSCTPIMEDGQVIGAVVTFRDISMRKRAEKELQKSRRQLAEIIEFLPDATFVVNNERKVIAWNRAMEEITGISKNEMIGRGDFEYSLPFYGSRRPLLIDLLFASEEKKTEYYDSVSTVGGTTVAEAYVPRAYGGKGAYLWGAATALLDEQGNVTGAIESIRDITPRKKAEEALRESEELYRTLVSLSPDPISVADLNGLLIFTSPKARQMFGYSPDDDILGRSILYWVAPEEQEKASANIRRLLTEGTVRATEYTLIKKDGTRFIGEVNGAVIHSPEGSPNPMKMIIITRDVTERKQAEVALAESEQRFKLLYEQAPMAYQSLDVNGNLIEVNQAWLEALGYTKQEVIGRHITDFLPPDWAAHFKDRFSRFKAVGEISGVEFEMVKKDGSTMLVSFNGKIARDAEGGFKQTHCIFQNITEQRRTEEEAKAQRETLTRVFESAPYIMMLVNRDVRVTYINQAGAAFAGKPKDELLDLLGGEIFSCLNSIDGWGCGRNLQCANCPVRTTVMHTFETGQSIHSAEGRLTMRKNSTDVTVDILISTALVRDKDADKVLVTIIDITDRKRGEEERKKLETQLFQAQKMESVGRLAGGVAHDFNNMLGVIIGRAELALNTDVATGELQDNLKEILNTGLRSADLTRQLLAFARKQTAIPKILDLNDRISGMLKMLRRLIGEDIDLSWQPGTDLWEVEIDPSQVDQILANLAVNARDAISGVGAITLRTENIVIDDSNRADHVEFIPGDYVQLTMSDTGEGMSKEVCEKIFEPFFTTKESGRGTGLGLSTVYGIVKQNDGFIYVESEPGKGATFKIYLPRSEDETAQVSYEKAPGKRPVGTETILLVEDDEAVLDLSKMILEVLGYTVLAVQNPLEAIPLAEGHPGDIHLLITDVVMPGMNGRELAERLDAIRPNLKCLYMSGYTADVIAKQGILEEGLSLIQKPFLSDELAARVRQVLDRSG